MGFEIELPVTALARLLALRLERKPKLCQILAQVQFHIQITEALAAFTKSYARLTVNDI